MGSIADNLERLHEQIAKAAQRADRKPSEIELIAVSKRQPIEKIREAVDAGHDLFGENRVNELQNKVGMLPSHCRWHMIGRLQSNKVGKVIPIAEQIHSVDCLELAQRIDRLAKEAGRFPKIYLQVNIAGDIAKSGFSPDALNQSMEDLFKLHQIEIVGLMTIPSYDPEPEASRIHFANLRKLAQSLGEEYNMPGLKLSMGMSGDYEVAIEEGSHCVRVGTALFGERSS